MFYRKAACAPTEANIQTGDWLKKSGEEFANGNNPCPAPLWLRYPPTSPTSPTTPRRFPSQPQKGRTKGGAWQSCSWRKRKTTYSPMKFGGQANQNHVTICAPIAASSDVGITTFPLGTFNSEIYFFLTQVSDWCTMYYVKYFFPVNSRIEYPLQLKYDVNVASVHLYFALRCQTL